MGAVLRIPLTLTGRGQGAVGGEIISLNCCKWLQINRAFGEKAPEGPTPKPIPTFMGAPFSFQAARAGLPVAALCGISASTRRRRGCLAHIRKLLHGDARPDSDLDVLVEFEAGHVPGLFRLAGMELELSALLGGTQGGPQHAAVPQPVFP
jgi:hypothetical protein